MILICLKLVMKQVPTIPSNHPRHVNPGGIHGQEGTRDEVSTTFNTAEHEARELTGMTLTRLCMLLLSIRTATSYTQNRHTSIEKGIHTWSELFFQFLNPCPVPYYKALAPNV